MEIHIVRAGETPRAIAERYGVSLRRLMGDNGIPADGRLAVGQALVVLTPETVHTVSRGETLFSIAARYGTTVDALLRSNWSLGGRTELREGEELVIRYRGAGTRRMEVNGYAYPFISPPLLARALPYLTWLTPFTYGFEESGALVPLDDSALIAAARARGVAPLMHLSTLTAEGTFSNAVAHTALTDLEVQALLIDGVLLTLEQNGYAGLDVDFEFVYPSDREAYAAFLAALYDRLAPAGYPLFAALAPKTSDDQPGLLYEAHDYALIGAVVDAVLLMTYEWGYAYGPPMAVAPLPSVRRVVEYALGHIPPSKLFMGIPNYGYDWTLPFVQGQSKAQSISMEEAVALAVRYGTEIGYDETVQSPFFHYTDGAGAAHEVWFEDARSIRAKLALVAESGLRGVGVWNLMRPFPQLWLVLNALYDVGPL